MKLNIKTLAASLAVGLAVVSCNNDFDETDYSAKVPEKATLGIWTREYTPADDMPFTVNVLVNEAGDTVCDVTYYDASSNMANVYSNGKVSYSKKTGTITAEFAEDADGSPARATITPDNDGKHAIVCVYNVGTDDNGEEELTAVDNFIAVASDTISVLGRWELKDGKTVQLDLGGKASVVDGEDVLSEGTYTFDGKTGTINVDGQAYAMNFNAAGNGQMNIGEGFANHVTRPLPDDWAEYAVGTYTSSALGASPSFETTLYYSASRHYFRMNPYAGSGYFPNASTYKFIWNKDDNTLKMKTSKGLAFGDLTFSSGATYSIFMDLATSDDIEDWNTKYPEDKVVATKADGDDITFCWKFYCVAGTLGLYNDTFEISDYIVDNE